MNGEALEFEKTQGLKCELHVMSNVASEAEGR